MKKFRLGVVLLAGAMAAHGGAVWAVRIDAAQPKTARTPSEVAIPDAAQRIGPLRDGTITKLDLPAGKLEIQGMPYTIVMGRTKFFRAGKSESPNMLRPGDKVKFSLMGDANRGSLAVVYAQ